MEQTTQSHSGAASTMQVTLAAAFHERLRGLLGSVQDERVLLLVPCKSIHTYGMRFAIDVAFVDTQGLVLLSIRDVADRKRITCPRAVAVLERATAPSKPWFIVGQSVALSIEDSRSVS